MQTTENTPVDAGARKSRINSTIVAAGVAFGLTLGGLGVAAAQTDPGGDGTTTTEAPAAAPAETPVTGDAAENVKAAALEAVPGGTVLRVETDADGSPYEAHVRKADGTEVVVKVDESFAVTAVEEHARKGGRGGPGGGRPANLLTGEAAEKATAAAQGAVEGGTVLRVQGAPDGSSYHAHVRKADGTEVVVRMDANFAVTGVEDAPAGRRGPGGPGGGQPPNLLTGEAAEKATAAAQAAVEGGTVLRVQGEPDGSGYHAHVRKADGTEVVVRMDGEFNVTGTEDAPAGGPRGHRGPRPGDGTTPPTTTA